MILNEKEKNQLILFLKKQYNTSKEMLDSNEYDWIKDDKTREEYIQYVQDLKEKYEAFENKNQVEIALPLFDFNENNGWNGCAGILGLIAVAMIFGGVGFKTPLDDTKDNKDLN